MLSLLIGVGASAAQIKRGDIANAVFGDDATFKAFMSAREVTAQRLHHRGGDADWFALSGYTRNDAVPVPAARATQLRKLFGDSKSYTWSHIPDEHGVSSQKACLPDYGVLLTFRGGGAPVRVALCFECDMFAVFVGDSAKPRRVNTEEDSDLIRSALVEIVRSLFPHDADIQALQSKT